MVTRDRFASPEEAWVEFPRKFASKPALKAIHLCLPVQADRPGRHEVQAGDMLSRGRQVQTGQDGVLPC